MKGDMQLPMHGSLRVLVYYRPPNSDLNEFLHYLELTVFGAGNMKAILTVDIIIDMLNQHETYAYRHTFHVDYGFIVTNDKITREESGRILDHLAINFNKIHLDNISFDTYVFLRIKGEFLALLATTIRLEYLRPRM
jgi:hypothetical protein